MRVMKFFEGSMSYVLAPCYTMLAKSAMVMQLLCGGAGQARW